MAYQNSKPTPLYQAPLPLDWFVMVVLAMLWGCSFLFIKRALVVYSPIQVAMWRMVIASIAYIPIAFIFWRKINWKKWKPIALVAFLGSALPSIFFAFGQQEVSSSLAGVLNSLAPLFTFLCGMALFGMAFQKWKLIGVLIGLIGAVLLVLQGATNSPNGSFFYALLCVMGTLCYALNANLIGTHLKGEHPAAIAAAAFMMTGVLYLIGLYWSDGWTVFQTEDVGGKALLYIAYLAVISTTLSAIAYFWLLQRTGPVFSTTVTYLIPIVAIILGVLDGELFGLWEALGTLIILSGLYLLRKG